MEKHTVTNEMLYELIKAGQTGQAGNTRSIQDLSELVKANQAENNRRFEVLHEDLSSFKADTNRRLDRLHEDNLEIRSILRNDQEKLEKVYESRDRVTVNFTRSWMHASFFIALLASTVVLAVSKAFS